MTEPYLIPTLRCHNPREAIDWLCRVFGMEQHAVYADDAGNVFHAELSLGRSILMIGPADTESPFPLKTTRELGGATSSIYVPVSDVDQRYELAKAAGAEILMDLHDTEYGSREFSCRDLEGNLWSFGTYEPFSAKESAV